MLNKSLQKELENGLPDPLYFLWSEENCFLEEAISQCVDTVLASGPVDFNYDVFDASSNPQQSIDTACTLPVMARRRLIVLKDFHQVPVSAFGVIKHYFIDPSETTCMIISSKKAPKASLKFSGKVFSLNIKEGEVPQWLKHTAAGMGVTLTGEAVELLIECVGYDIGLLLMELEKLTLLGSRTVTGRDIMASTSMMRKYTSFDLVDTLIAGQKTRAFRILKTMLSGNAFDAPVILGTLNWHFKQFYTLWLHKGKRPLRMRERTYRTLMKYLPAFDEEDFLHIFRSMHEADVGIKTSGRPAIVLEILLIRLLQKGAWN
jgi:DNA polymerase-3 subunit delta